MHPTKAFAWELRLQDEIRPDFTIDEPGSNEARAKFLRAHESHASEIVADEAKRRERKATKTEESSENGPLFDDADESGRDDADE